MKIRSSLEIESWHVVQLFESVFTDSEGHTQGALVGRLAKDLFEKTDEDDLHNFVAVSDGQLLASISFSRLRFETDTSAFLLAPVAVHSQHQGKGIGQALIGYGLNALREKDVSFALTYGDPSFYSKVGFQAVSQDTIRAPYELSQPEGWLGQSLAGASIDSLSGECECFEALKDPAYW